MMKKCTLGCLKQKIKNLLIWSQKYTETDNIYLAKGGFWLILGQVVSTGISFLLAVAFANLLSPTIYGNYKYVLSLVGILGIFSLSGMGTAVTQAVARNLEGSFYVAFKTKLKWGLLGSVAAVGMAIYYWVQGNEILPIPLLITAIFLPLMLASQVYLSFLEGKKLFDIEIKYSTVSKVVFAITIAVALFLTKNLFWLIAVYFVSNTFLNYFFYLLTRAKFRPNKEKDPKTISYGKHLAFMGVINVVSKHFDKVLLFTLIGSAEVAIYSFAMAIPDQIRSIMSSAGILALPKLATKSQKEIKANVMKKVWKLFFLVGVIIAAYILLAPIVYKIFFPQYLVSIAYSQLFILSLLSFPVFLLDATFQAKMMKKELYLLRIVSVLRLILLIVLVPIYGILGAVLAMLGAHIFGAALVLFLFHFSLRHV